MRMSRMDKEDRKAGVEPGRDEKKYIKKDQDTRIFYSFSPGIQLHWGIFHL